jgi:hypothetical protein
MPIINEKRLKIDYIESSGNFSLYSSHRYKENFFGIVYDPEDRIYAAPGFLQETMDCVKRDQHFGLYLNSPTYKTLFIDSNKEYGENTRTGQTYYVPRRTVKLYFRKKLYDIDKNGNIIKLEFPENDPDDGFIVVHSRPHNKPDTESEE